MSYNSDTLWRLYGIGGADLALRYAEMSREASARRPEPEPQRYLTIVDLRFFAGDGQFSEAAARQFASSFPASSTKYVWFTVELQNPWRYISCDYELVARYYRPDGSKHEITRKFAIPAECPTFSHSSAIGWDTPGKWAPGQYRVEVLVDGRQRSGEFAIADDCAKSNAVDPLSDLLSQDWLTGFRRAAEGPAASSTDELPAVLGFRNRRYNANKKFPGIGDALFGSIPKPDAVSKRGLGLIGWLDTFDKELPITPTGLPLTDLEKSQRLLALDRRQLAALPKTTAGLATPQIVQELETIAADYEALLPAGAPSFLYTEQSVRRKIADTLSMAAQACKSIGDDERWKKLCHRAAAAFRSANDEQQARQCEADLERWKLADTGDVDGEIRRLRKQLEKDQRGSLASARTMIDLALVYSGNGDDHEALELLQEAEKVLDALGGPPDGAGLASALEQTMLSIMGKSEDADANPLIASVLGPTRGPPRGGSAAIAAKLEMQGLYRVLYAGYERVYAKSNPAKAASYRAKASKFDSREQNDIFSANMLRALKGGLGTL